MHHHVSWNDILQMISVPSDWGLVCTQLCGFMRFKPQVAQTKLWGTMCFKLYPGQLCGNMCLQIEPWSALNYAVFGLNYALSEETLLLSIIFLLLICSIGWLLIPVFLGERKEVLSIHFLHAIHSYIHFLCWRKATAYGGHIDGGSSFIHDENAGLAYKGPGQAEELSLADAEVLSSFSDHGIWTRVKRQVWFGN